MSDCYIEPCIRTVVVVVGIEYYYVRYYSINFAILHHNDATIIDRCPDSKGELYTYGHIDYFETCSHCNSSNYLCISCMKLCKKLGDKGPCVKFIEFVFTHRFSCRFLNYRTEETTYDCSYSRSLMCLYELVCGFMTVCICTMAYVYTSSRATTGEV